MSSEANRTRYVDSWNNHQRGDASRDGLISNSRRRKTTFIRVVLACLLMIGFALAPSTGRGGDDKSIQQRDAARIEELLTCDRQAEREAAEASNLTPIAPVSVLNPILLLNDLHRRKQEEKNQPKLLEQIEMKRQQCRKNVAAAAARRAQEVIDQKSDASHGYKLISFETFALDARSLAKAQAKISIKGSYLPDGNFEWLFPSQVQALQARSNSVPGGNIKIALLTEDASREFRKTLLKCKSTPGADQIGCLTTIIGHVSLCSITGPLGAGQEIPCIIVENGREVR